MSTATSPEFTGQRRRSVSLSEARQTFLRHQTPWLMTGVLLCAGMVRVALGGWTATDALIPLAILAAFPMVEWLTHVLILHLRPRRLGRFRLDPLVARKHRAHHVDPRQEELIFIPMPVLVQLLVFHLLVGIVAFALPQGLTYVLCWTVSGLVYEWTHFLIHSDYRPRSRFYRSIWRNHRLHHYKNERYWFAVATAGTADRILGTYPDPAAVETSPTARNLHGEAAA